jgi:uncharacterized tellurite resistance protein B-like protein
MRSQTRRHLPQKRTETLDYLQQMLGQLRNMAEAERCDFLAYLIEMAYIEAGDIIRGERPSRIAQDKADTPAGVPVEPSGKIKLQ